MKQLIITLTGTTEDSVKGDGKEMAVKERFKIADDKTQLMEMYAPDGKEFKMMQIKFTRK